MKYTSYIKAIRGNERYYRNLTRIRKVIATAKVPILLLLLPLFGMGQDTTRTYKAFCDCYEIRTKDFVWWEPSLRKDTIPATILVQFTYRDAITVRDVYLINGEPWYRSKAPLTKGKWIKPNWYRWKLSNGWSK